MFDVAVDGPLEYVKESLKVWLRGSRAKVSAQVLTMVIRLVATTLPSLRRISIKKMHFKIKASTRVTSER